MLILPVHVITIRIRDIKTHSHSFSPWGRCWVVHEQEAETDGGHDLWSATGDSPVYPPEGVWS